MTLQEIEQNLKKDPPSSWMIIVHRPIGILLTYVFVNFFPRISANMLTIIMGILNVIAAIISGCSIVRGSSILAIIGFFVFFISLSLDCADGNIARINNDVSIKGVLLDRLVHNITHPTIFLIQGFSLSLKTNSVIYLFVFAIASILVEFSPFQTSFNDVKLSFVNQLLYKETKNFFLEEYRFNYCSDVQVQKTKNRNGVMSKLKSVVKFLFSIDMLFVCIVVDSFCFAEKYYISVIFTILYCILKLIKDCFMHEDINNFFSLLKDYSLFNR